MPWEVKKQGSGEEPYKVVKSDTGRVVASHETREQAEAHVKALYANADDTKGESRNSKRQDRRPDRGGPPPGRMGRGGGAPRGAAPRGRNMPPAGAAKSNKKRTPVGGARRRMIR